MYVYFFHIAAPSIWLRIINVYKDVNYVQLCMHYISIHKCNCYTYPDAFMKVFQVLSMEMDPAEALQSYMRHLVQLLAIWKQIASDAHRSVSSGLLSTTYLRVKN